MFTQCSTEQSVLDAVKVLADAEYVILDCEGRNLGCSSGVLSLISIGTPKASYVYVFDVLALPRDALLPLFNDIISSQAKLKVVWDGRMDHTELFFGHSCPIENVLDLQLVDVLSRERRGQNDRRRLGRFARRDFPMPQVNKLQLEEMHVLNGMDFTLKEHGVIGAPAKNESVKRLHANNLSEMWMQRPLSNDLLEYAAADITRIARLYDHFLARGYLQDMNHLRQLSCLYVTMHQAEGRPDKANVFLQGPFLPLTIPLSRSPQQAVSSVEPTKECSKCKRGIPERHFPIASRIEQGQLVTFADANNLVRLSTCKVCTLILAKEAYVEDGEGNPNLMFNPRELEALLRSMTSR